MSARIHALTTRDRCSPGAGDRADMASAAILTRQSVGQQPLEGDARRFRPFD